MSRTWGHTAPFPEVRFFIFFWLVISSITLQEGASEQDALSLEQPASDNDHRARKLMAVYEGQSDRPLFPGECLLREIVTTEYLHFSSHSTCFTLVAARPRQSDKRGPWDLSLELLYTTRELPGAVFMNQSISGAVYTTASQPRRAKTKKLRSQIPQRAAVFISFVLGHRNTSETR